MAVILHQLDDAPILIVRYQGFIDLKTVETATAQVAQVLRDSPVPLYGVIDLTLATTDIPNLLRILYHQSRGDLGSISEGGSRVVMVGTHPLIRIFRKMFRLEEFGGRIVPIFTSTETALAALRARIEEDAEKLPM